jgi:hypothetical protein
MGDMRNRPVETAALVLLQQDAPLIPLGQPGLWFDGVTVYFVDPSGTATPVPTPPTPPTPPAPLDYGVVGDILPVAAAASAGVLDKVARADHQHAALATVYGDVADILPVGATASAGVLDKTARADHQHVLAADGSDVAAIANATAAAGLPLIRRFRIAPGANGNTDITLLRKERLIDAWLVLIGNGVAGATLALRSGGAAIATVDLSARLANDIVRLSTLDLGQQDIGAGARLRVNKTSTGGDFGGCEVYVMTMAVP